MTKGYADEWLPYHDRLKREADEKHRAYVAWWTRAAAIGAIFAAIATALEAPFGYLALK